MAAALRFPALFTEVHSAEISAGGVAYATEVAWLWRISLREPMGEVSAQAAPTDAKVVSVGLRFTRARGGAVTYEPSDPASAQAAIAWAKKHRGRTAEDFKWEAP